MATRLIRHLEERAPALPQKARERLLERANVHLDDLDRRFRASREKERVPNPVAAERLSSERPSEIRPRTKQITRSQYDETAAAAAAQLALVRAEDAIPEVAGRYHPSEAVARALRMMERLGRPYLYAQLRRFEGFAALSALETLDPPPPKKRRKKKRSR